MILKNCRLIPQLCEGFEEEMADIRIDKKKIAEILPVNGNYTGEEVIDLDETPLGLFDPMTELIDDFATALTGLPMAVRVGMSVCIAGLGAWLILLFVRKKEKKKNE